MFEKRVINFFNKKKLFISKRLRYHKEKEII